MKRHIAAALVLFVGIAVAQQPATEAQKPAQADAAKPATPPASAFKKESYDKAQILKYLKDSRQNFLNSIKDVSDEQWNFKASSESWSIGETAEHIAVSEKVIGEMISQRVFTSPAVDEAKMKEVEGKEGMIVQRIPDRTTKAKAPEMLQPKKAFATKAELIAAFEAERAKVMEFLDKNYDELRKHVGRSPLGELDGAQWSLFTGAHSNRHTAQIQEVKTAAGYPKK